MINYKYVSMYVKKYNINTTLMSNQCTFQCTLIILINDT